MNTKKTLTYIDLFAGAGGLSEGFINRGFEPIIHIEMNADACYTLKTRLAYHHLLKNNKLGVYESYLKGRISKQDLYSQLPASFLDTVLNLRIEENTLDHIYNQIDKNLNLLNIRSVDLLIGGPPCQSYSLIGRHNVDWDTDQRVSLYKLYGQILAKYKPSMFLFENVPGILSANKGEYFNDLKHYYDKIGYDVNYQILKAEEFGVLQSRRRVIIIGSLKEKKLVYPEFEKETPLYTVADVFHDLKILKPGDSITVDKYQKEASDYQRKYRIRCDFNFYTQHIARSHNKNDLAIYKIAQDKWNNENHRLKYNDLPKRLRTQNNVSSFLDRFKVVDINGLSHTLVAHIAKDGHYYIHPTQLRSISVREAARLQSFPDNYFFEGSRSAAFTQIGNAVPPLMSYALAKKIQEILWER
ncbi:DNA cytosine methyltransferase [Bartonella sp. HY329]|uniref:DNA cytosine methyltransferase n=1 Tax=unclassified Bartonella TaxID=2645622 RepID=UPI0021C5A5FB|nr:MULTISPECIES: DNA cytosine methyltransferase [unclassified Bartonella]UXM93973.1 DNA cytosine methyltransferase [Bartonella sp. HY329]UXN08294.1 DNA cytosine methyltransferase [Bartonella sp. HY328]